MKKIIIVIFGIFIFLMMNPLCAKAILPPPPPNANAKPVLIKTKGLKVYIPPKDTLTETMKHAFLDWQKHTDGNFTFDFVGTKSTANITVIFVESDINTICQNGDALGCTSFVAANTVHGNKRILGAKIYISIYDNEGQPMTKNQVYTIMLHEIGHALGLQHSENEKSLMYEGTNSQMAEIQEIQPEDVKALYELYNIE